MNIFVEFKLLLEKLAKVCSCFLQKSLKREQRPVLCEKTLIKNEKDGIMLLGTNSLQALIYLI